MSWSSTYTIYTLGHKRCHIIFMTPEVRKYMYIKINDNTLIIKKSIIGVLISVSETLSYRELIQKNKMNTTQAQIYRPSEDKAAMEPAPHHATFRHPSRTTPGRRSP